MNRGLVLWRSSAVGSQLLHQEFQRESLPAISARPCAGACCTRAGSWGVLVELRSAWRALLHGSPARAPRPDVCYAGRDSPEAALYCTAPGAERSAAVRMEAEKMLNEGTAHRAIDRLLCNAGSWPIKFSPRNQFPALR